MIVGLPPSGTPAYIRLRTGQRRTEAAGDALRPALETAKLTLGKVLEAGGCSACSMLLDGRTFGVPGTITPLVDLWLEECRLPVHMRNRRA